ncbi:gamma-glutamyltransferase family protein [Alicyclobacillus acidocaldarius]|uniref:Gamma-glutamyltransferase n=1 Tax=Alicyclobacillus acidocaldarius subsp. acidocaldarius (strain ATCC 27009 / DSM 446 / BCRC 14685 / JCM 5260 / KCTC 1825 / NBRC 15652 / NCIMB 11725 / NRRL B-14509 / 104-IA) TaxID=521098 RepID=C8WQ39_ALIAD|nr:gamma-glutamyltransferase family protein [Alicyclobacillus acidocaldarius]ACV57143.1 Gamma-glutamyltransferase [Alicyclobacillus acidocaldarius subsp. acidocaldarius DSM 446]
MVKPHWDATQYEFESRRTVVFARRGMVATTQPLASEAGLEVLRRGGNAIDAVVAAAAALAIVEPTSNGIGSDAFAIVWKDGKLHGLNASGHSPERLTRDELERRGLRELPTHGWLPVTVPGAPAAWAALVERFGRLSLKDVLAPAVDLARDGFPVQPVTARNWRRAMEAHRDRLTDPVHEPFFRLFAPGGEVPGPGDLFRNPDGARALEAIASSGGRAFYEGEIADAIDAFARETGGLLSKADLAAYKPEWVEPLSVRYRDFEVWELPPNGQGIVALMALGALAGMDLASMDEADRAHAMLEAIKLAFEVALREVADPRFMRVTPASLLSKDHLDALRAKIGDEAHLPAVERPYYGGTVYLCAADGEGNMVSYIQSNYMGFGSGIVVPGTGVSLQNRGHNFSMDPSHPNALGPRKRPYHTIIPGFLTRGGEPVGPFGVMGGFMQPQGHVQVLVQMLDLARNPQSALDAPRWQWLQGKRVLAEAALGEDVIAKLRARGHEVDVTDDGTPFGRGQVIWRLPNGALAGATEPRADGSIAAW